MLCLYIDLTPLQNQYWQLILETLKSILLIVINIGCSGLSYMKKTELRVDEGPHFSDAAILQAECSSTTRAEVPN